jgi:molecular chaperone DnaK
MEPQLRRAAEVGFAAHPALRIGDRAYAMTARALPDERAVLAVLRDRTDELRRELAEVRNQAETLLYTTEAALEGYANIVDPQMLEDTRTLARELRALLEAQSDLAQIRDAYQKLEAATFAIAEKMYGDGGEEPSAPI